MDISKQLNIYVNEYKKFMGINHFPKYILQTQEVSTSTADLQGFEVAAATFYQPLIHQHTLIISTNLNLSKYLMFHEFTHMYDSELYVNGDKMRYAGLSGYTEYHASQVELVQLLGAKTIDKIPSFSMNMIISTVAGDKSVLKYVQEKYQHAIDLFSRVDFPANVNTLKTAVGVLYNYWGLRSICEMYATNFVETIDNRAFIKFIPAMNFTLLNNLMHGWLDKTNIDLSINLYVSTIFPIIQDYKLV
nr:hypothetical protein [uncultured Ruminococcus sp.]